MKLIRSNPYGIQPLGNKIFSTQHKTHGSSGQRTTGLGNMQVFDDDFLVSQLFTYFDGKCLSFLSVCSTYLYACCHYDELWKNLVLVLEGGNFEYDNTWKETVTGVKHNPICVNVFSDVLYQPFLCSSLQIPEIWKNVNSIPRESCLSLSTEGFIKRYEQPNIPVVITDCEHLGWDAYAKWNKDYLLHHSSHTTFESGGVSLPLRSYFQYSEQQQDDCPMYLFDKHFIHNTPQFGLDYQPLPYFSKERDLFEVLDGTPYRPDHQWLIIGPERSGSRFHVDPNGTSAWNAVISGAKKWILFPTVPPGVHPSPDGSDVTSPVSLIEWFRGFYDESRRGMLLKGNGMVECVVRSGETLFVPSGWYHLVINLEFTIAITQNYVSTSNLLNVMNYLSRSPKLISGLPHDKRSELRTKFRNALREKKTDIYDFLMKEEQLQIEKDSKKKNELNCRENGQN